MADVLTPEQRRLIMSRIRGRDTKPEMLCAAACLREVWLPTSQGSAGMPRLGIPWPSRGRVCPWLLLAWP